MSDKLHDVDEKRSEEIAKQIANIEKSGERSFHAHLDISLSDLKELRDRLRLLDETDRLGEIELVSIVDDSDIDD